MAARLGRGENSEVGVVGEVAVHPGLEKDPELADEIADRGGVRSPTELQGKANLREALARARS
jgi:hypothetical protein